MNQTEFIPDAVQPSAVPEEKVGGGEAFLKSAALANSVASNIVFDMEEPGYAKLEAQEQQAQRLVEEQDFMEGRYDYEEYMPDQYKQHSLDYAATTSPREATELTMALDKKMEYYKDLEGHEVISFLGGMVGGVTDPVQLPLVYLMPTGALLSKASKVRLGLTAATRAGIKTTMADTAGVVFHGAKIGLAAGALAEATSGVPGVSVEEQVYSVLASGMFNATLAGAGLHMKLMHQAVERVDLDMRTIDTDPIISELGPLPKYDGEVPGHVVEKAVALADDQVEKGLLEPAEHEAFVDQLVQNAVKTSSELLHPKFYKAAGFMQPVIRLMTSPLHEARVLASQILTSPLQRKNMQVDPSVSLMVRMQTDSFNVKVHDTVNTRFKEYVKATDRDRMNHQQFAEEVSQAIADNGVHENLQVSSAAKDIAKHIQAIEQRQLKAGVIKRGYRGHENVTVDDILELGLTKKELSKLLRTVEPMDDANVAESMKAVREGYEYPNANEFFDKLEAKYFPDKGPYQGYTTDLTKMANRILLNTSAKTREFRARVKGLQKQFLEGKNENVLSFEFELKLEELMAEYDVPNFRARLKGLEKKHFSGEDKQMSFNQAVEDFAAKREMEKEMFFAQEEAKLRESEVVVDADAVADLSDEALHKLYERGKLDMYSAEVSGDAGHMFRHYDARKVNADPKAFKDYIVSVLKEEFAKAKGDANLDLRMSETREAIVALREKVKKEGEATPEHISPEQRELDLLEYESMAKDPTVPKRELAAFKEKIDGLVKGESESAAQLRAEEAELARLQKVKEERWEDIEAEIPGFVEDVKSRILHQGHKDGFKTIGLESVTLGDRTVHVSYEKMKPWLNANVTESLQRYIERSVPELLMAERFGGKQGFKREMDKVLAAFDREIDAAPTKKARAKMNKAKSAFGKDMRAMEESIYRRYGLSENPDGIIHKGSQYLRWFNMLNNLGLMAVSAIPDLGSIIARQGMNALQFHKYMWAPEGKAYRGFLKDSGITADLVLSRSHERMVLADSEFTVGSRFNMMARNAVKKFNMVTGMNHWNAYLKQFVAGVHGMGLVRDAHAFKAGKLSPKQLKRIRTSFLTEEHLTRIAELTEPGQPLDVSNWPADLRQRFTSAIFNEADTVIVTPSLGDMPLMASSDLGKIILQFKAFALASNHKLLLSTIDDVTAQKIIGLASMVFFGHISQAAKAAIKGEPLSDDQDTLIKNAVNAAGISALGMEVNAMLERLTQGQLSVFTLLGIDGGDAITFNHNQSLIDLLAGPTAGTASNVQHIAAMMASGKVRESDIRAVRRSFALNNHWATYRGFNKLEQMAKERWVR